MGDFAEQIRQAVKKAQEERQNQKVVREIMEVESCEACDGRGFFLCDKVVQEARWLAKEITVRSSDPCEECDGKGYHLM
jgi:DnaJ-class molecular chaperone